MEPFTVRERIIETVNKLFLYTDNKDWDMLRKDVFSSEVDLDMSSIDGPDKTMTSGEICKMWAEGFSGIDQINHLAGNYLVTLLAPDHAVVFCYATATHFTEAAKNGKTREFTGSYDIRLHQGEDGWRINHLAYKLKYSLGNINLD